MNSLFISTDPNFMQNNMTEMYQEEIASLQEEILELTQKYKDNQKEVAFLSRTNLKKALLSYRGKEITDGERKHDSAVTKPELSHYESEVQFFNKICGTEFTKYFKKREHKSENEVLYKHRLLGRCQSLSFQLEFQTLDSKVQESGSCEVTDLNIILGCRENSSLSKFVSRTEERKSLVLFFRTLSSFAEWCEYRKQTFVRFKEKYPSAVGLPLGSSGEYVALRNPKLPGCELLLVWKIEIDEEGAVLPVLDLLPKMPDQALALDKMKVIEEAATGFRNLLQAFGIESSIENIIRVFCLPETEMST
ncbi:centromere protein P [Spea bombifrons]|uniref:centromere protein P n=1 Tax=Spea bombifrons TaxID=233779 RepID=UPI0023493C5B|nr:centromere protein P [Spea bombifrons]